MVTTAEALSVLRPTIVFGVGGVQITERDGATTIIWNDAFGTQPTQSQLDAVTQAQVDAAKDAKEAINKPEQNDLRKALSDDIVKCDEIIALTAVNLAQALNRMQQMARINKRILRYLRKAIE